MQSVWLKDYRSQNYRTDKKNAEVIIIGAGLSGLLTAWQLLQSGLDVLVLEAREIGQVHPDIQPENYKPASDLLPSVSPGSG